MTKWKLRKMWQVAQVQLAYGGHGPSTVTTDSHLVSCDRGLGASLKHQGAPRGRGNVHSSGVFISMTGLSFWLSCWCYSPYLTIWFMSAFFSLKSLDKYQETKGLVISREEKQEMKPDLHKMWELPDFIWRRKKRDFFFLNPKFYMQSGKSLGFGGHFLI